MKEKIINLLGGLLFCAVLCCLGGFEDYIKTSYTREATIIEYNNNTYTIEDDTGHTWKFDGKGYSIGDRVKLYMNTNHTDSNIFDDEITKMKIIEED